MEEDRRSLKHAESASALLKLPSSPISSDHDGGTAPFARLNQQASANNAKLKRVEATRLPTVLQDLASLERERSRLLSELQSVREAREAVQVRLRNAEASKLKQLEAMGKYDRFFLNDKGAHPLGRRYAVQQTAVAIKKQLDKLDNQKLKILGKINKAVDANNEVKTRIDVLRRESVVFRELFAKMEVENSIIVVTVL